MAPHPESIVGEVVRRLQEVDAQLQQRILLYRGLGANGVSEDFERLRLVELAPVLQMLGPLVTADRLEAIAADMPIEPIEPIEPTRERGHVPARPERCTLTTGWPRVLIPTHLARAQRASRLVPMPLAPWKPCPAGGCAELTRGGPCARHKAAHHQHIDARRGTATERGYGAAWRRVRARVLSSIRTAYRDASGIMRGSGPLCVMCFLDEPRRLTPATDVDHIDGNARNNALVNLRPLCHACHSRRTATDQAFGRRRA